MNCNNCGGPLTPVVGGDHLECEFCHTFHFPDALEDSADGVKPQGGHADEKCPHCCTALAHGKIDGTKLLYCETCRGLLVNSEALSIVIHRRRATYQGPDDRPSPLDPQQLHRATHCPTCQGKMETHAYAGPGTVVIDSCGRCKQVWLDSGEVAMIERAPGRR